MLKHSVIILDKAIKEAKKTKKSVTLDEKDATAMLKYLESLEDIKKLTDKVK